MAHTPEHVEGASLPPELLTGEFAQAIAEALAGVGGADRSPPVFMGSSIRPSRTRGHWGPKTKVAEDIRTEDEAVNDFYSWDDNKLRDFQERAFSAGLYGTSDRSRVRFGDPTDADTFAIWKNRVGVAAGFMNAGRKITPWDTLDLAAQGNTGAAGGPSGVTVSNPIDMREALKVAATEVLGGAITDEQIKAISDRFQQQQIGAQRAEQNAAGGVTTAAPSFGAFAKEQVRALDPIKADSRGAVKVASVIQQMMEGKMPAQRLGGG